MGRLAGKSALVIGASRGIGRAVCEAFAREGACIAVADVGPAKARQAVITSLNDGGATAIERECDVLIEAQVAGTVEEAIRVFGKLDILVNNAGVGAPAVPFQALTTEQWQSVIDINLRGVAFGMKWALPHMLSRAYGRIINTASQLAHKPAPWQGVYCASKAAVVALTASVAQEVASKGVTVNCVSPGPTDTQIWRQSDANWIEWKTAQLPIGRVARPEEIASAYVYLASDEASYMVGQSLSPNGGDVTG